MDNEGTRFDQNIRGSIVIANDDAFNQQMRMKEAENVQSFVMTDVQDQNLHSFYYKLQPMACDDI